MNILVLGITKTYGGVESFFMNYYREFMKKGILSVDASTGDQNADMSKLHFDFLCVTPDKIAYQDEIESYGGQIYRITARSRNPIEFKKELRDFFVNYGKKYDVLWMNDNSLANVDYLKEAKRVGIPHIIMHCHNDRDMSSRVQAILHRVHKRSIGVLATDYWACSDEAAEYCFSGEAKKKAVVITNAIDLNEKTFDPAKRIDFRKDNDIENRFVIGNVGRLHFQKNQMFILDIMSKLIEKTHLMKLREPILILVGTGPDEEKLRNRITELGLEDHVRLLGRQDDIQAVLSGMDLFLFPSVFEGLGIAALEAELNGLSVLASDTVPEITGVNPNYERLPIESTSKWVEKIIEVMSSDDFIGRISSDEARKNLKQAGYDIGIESDKLEKRFLNL